MTRQYQISTSQVEWVSAFRIILSVFPPIGLFEDIAGPADLPPLISAEQNTNLRMMSTIGDIELALPDRRVGGPSASCFMAAFNHVSVDRSSRFSDGTCSVLDDWCGHERLPVVGALTSSWPSAMDFRVAAQTLT